MLLQIGLTPAQSSSMVVSFGLYLSCGQEHDRPTPPSMQGLHTEVVISELNTWPVGTPVNASPASLRMQVHDSEPKWCATPFLCGSLIRYSMPVYLGASLITLSARNSTDCGIVRLSAFAVLRLMTNSNFVGCSTGRSAGLVPFRILSTYT